MNYKLSNLKTNDLEKLNREVQQGGKFIVFNYRVGLGFISLLKFSPAIFIRKSEKDETFKKKYNIINLLLGPWFVIKGPYLTYLTYKTNIAGGIDVTNDVMLNLTQKQLSTNEVTIKEIHSIFSKVNKGDLKNIKKVFANVDKSIIPYRRAYAALFVNVEEYEEPPFVIGLELVDNREIDIHHLKTCFNKYFYKHVVFDFITLKESDDISEKLIEQGEII